jgi:hypothetical protein
VEENSKDPRISGLNEEVQEFESQSIANYEKEEDEFWSDICSEIDHGTAQNKKKE